METKRFGHVQIPFKRIHIELTNKCDFNCVFCPKSEMTRAYGSMDPDLAMRTMTDIKRLGLAEKVTFHVMGEPTLHKNFFDLLRHAEKLDLPVGLTTNAAGLGRKIGPQLLEHELHQLDLSLQTPTETSFALRKAGLLTYDAYLKGIFDFFAEYRRRWPETIIKFRFLNTTFPPKTLEKSTGKSIRVISGSKELRDSFSYWAKRLHDALDIPDSLRDTVQARIAKLRAWQWNVIEVSPNTFFETYILSDWGHAFGKEKIREAWGGFCFGMRDHFAILHNGDVTLCCIDYDGHTVVGNLKEQSLEEVLSGEPLGGIMAAFRRFRLKHPYCRYCLGSKGLGSWLVKPVAGIAALHLLKPYFYKRHPLKESDLAN